MKTILVTGSSGLIGSEVVTFFHNKGFQVHGMENERSPKAKCKLAAEQV